MKSELPFFHTKVTCFLLFYYLSIIDCYDSTYLQNPKENTNVNSGIRGSDGCLAYYDQGATNVSDCTQWILDDPNFICCLVNYTIGKDYSNSFCMPVANTSSFISDIKYSFRNADDIEILCQSSINNINIIFSFIITLLLLL